MFVLATENKALNVVATSATIICFVSLYLIKKVKFHLKTIFTLHFCALVYALYRIQKPSP